jgi:hypothetical protein
MKKAVFTSFLLLIISFFYCCKKTDSSSSNPAANHNGFTINNIFYNTEKVGIAIAHDTFALIFYSTSVSFNINEQHRKGVGHAVAFGELISDSMVSGFPVGNYLYQDNEQSGTFSDGQSLMNYNFSEDTGVEKGCIQGNINIIKNGNQFQIKYNLLNEDSSRETGVFNGFLPDITTWFHEKKYKKVRIAYEKVK